MRFIATELQGAYIIELDPREDERGSFARAWSASEFALQGFDVKVAECSISTNKKRGTVRGLHFQIPPHAETKLVRCTRGAMYDIIIDMRVGSPTFRQWIGVELSPENGRMMYVPKGFAHGFQTLKDNTDVYYQISECYAPESQRGVRWNDPAFNIRLREPVTVISKRDAEYSDFDGSGFVL